ncbi:hypothetical protein [Pseudanabaena sp. Chao 1811]|uniref:hypothetical protein n=1 Tax=Pseudanabaena sp. Chao 1811 TaxID=2963092 RepID=UPI0022F3945E|nr:hypothetical protein [Pseudanabaena sp. Chao 1811]
MTSRAFIFAASLTAKRLLRAIALSSQLAVWSTRNYLAEQSRRVSWDAFEKVLAKVPNWETDEHDRL